LITYMLYALMASNGSYSREIFYNNLSMAERLLMIFDRDDRIVNENYAIG